MNFKKTLVALLATATCSSAFAGGMLTNTNQSIAFLRNPAREGAIGIDGVYSNPAGVAFLKDGWHFTLNWQSATQTRTVVTTSPYFDHTLSTIDSDGNPKSDMDYPSKRYRGHAAVPFIPSLGAAYNKGKWSFQFNFAVTGGGGKCEFENGIGTFDNAVGSIAANLKQLDAFGIGAKGYGCDTYMEGRQYYYGFTLGAAYKITDYLSVYAGLRGLLGTANYAAQISNIQVATSDGLKNLGDYIDWADKRLDAIGIILPNQAAQGKAGLAEIESVVTGDGDDNRNDVNLKCDQSGFGISPIIGADVKFWRINLAAKYEFRTKMSLNNSSNLKTASIDATAQFVDGKSVREDSPALLAFGAQYSPIDMVRVNLAYHHFYDKDSKKYGDKQKNLSCGTNEYLAGVEVDVTPRLTVSTGAQITRYGNTDEFISDLSFVTNSCSWGFGASYQANPNVRIEAAYFKTFYNHYTTATSANGVTNDFIRSNDVIGVGLVIDL